MIQKNNFLLLKMASTGLKALHGPICHGSKDHDWLKESNVVLQVIQGEA